MSAADRDRGQSTRPRPKKNHLRIFPVPEEQLIIDLATYPYPTISTAQLAAYWGVHEKSIRRDIHKGALRAYRVGHVGHLMRIHIHDARTYGRPVDAPAEETQIERLRRYQRDRGATTHLI